MLLISAQLKLYVGASDKPQTRLKAVTQSPETKAVVVAVTSVELPKRSPKCTTLASAQAQQ